MTNNPHLKGLTTAEAELRLKRDGHNVLPMKSVSAFHILLKQFKSAIVLLLLVASAISWVVGDASGSIVIALIIVVNAAIGFIQEFKAEHRLYQVSSLLKPTAVVRRDGIFSDIPRENLVVGDVVQLTPGCIIPADIVLSFAEGLSVDESSLTGESVPVEKSPEKDPKAEMGTVVSQGIGEGTVTAVGAKAMFGQVVNLAETGRPTNFEKEVSRLSEFCIGMIVVITVALFVAKLVFHPAEALSIEFLVFILAIAIGILPETLPLVATVALSHGAMSLARFGVIVRNLGAIRDFGSITVLCSDKTGTLTENKLNVSSHLAADEALYASLLHIAAGLKSSLSDPFQRSIGEVAKEKSSEKLELLRAIPFDAERRFASFQVRMGAKTHDVRQGAYEVIVPPSHRTKEQAAWIAEHEGNGERVLAFALKEGDSPEKLAALVSFEDPVRASAKHALAKARRLGVQIKMISGDSELVSESVARKLGILPPDGHATTGTQWDALSDADKRHTAFVQTAFARFFPTQKYELVRILTDAGEVVGYMGDGVNDAPSLKLADVGIAVKNATDIAKSAADIILLKPGLDVVIHGIEQGRVIFENVSKYLRETLTENLGNFLSLSVLSLFIPFLPMLPIQILVTNLITDFPHLAIATDTVDAASLKAPKRLKLQSLLRFMIFLSLVSSAADLSFFWLFRGADPTEVQTGWFILSTFAELLSLISVRSRDYFFRSTFPAPLLLWSTIAVGGFVVAAPYVPLLRDMLKLAPIPGFFLAAIATIAVLYLVTFDVVKKFIYDRWPQTY